MRRLLGGGAAVAGVIGAAVILASYVPADIPGNHEGWGMVIREEGAANAYETMIQALEHEPPEVSHGEAHLFGQALFEAAGLDGLSVCDERFAYGCFHELMGQAIHAYGLGIVRSFTEICRDTGETEVDACMHGIGHGIVASLGYERVELNSAVDICAAMDSRQEQRACYGGVFMEYNLRIMAEDGTRALGDDPFDVCADFSGFVRRTCVFSLPQWWFRNLPGTREDKFVRMGELCAQDSDRAYCAGGIGYIVMVESDARTDRAIELCTIAAQSPRDELACRSIGAQAFSLFFDTPTGERMCDDLDDAGRAFCLSYARMPSGQRPSLSTLL